MALVTTQQMNLTLWIGKGVIIIKLINKIKKTFSKRLFKEWSGNMSCYDMMQNLGDELWEEFREGEHGAREDTDEGGIKLEMYTDEGESCEINFEREGNVSNAISSVRVIEFKNEIIATNGEVPQ